MSLPQKKKLFAERVEFALIEQMTSLAGVAKLINPELASRLRALYGEHIDISAETLANLRSPKNQEKLKETLVPIFWSEFSSGIRLLEVRSRLCFGLPDGIAPASSCSFDVNPSKWSAKMYHSTLKSLSATPFRIDGVQRGVFDDIAIFDLPDSMISETDGSVDFTEIEKFFSLGTTISFYFPSPRHQRWYTFCKNHSFPPAIRCGKKLSVIFNNLINDDVASIVFGVDTSAKSVTGLSHDVGKLDELRPNR